MTFETDLTPRQVKALSDAYKALLADRHTNVAKLSRLSGYSRTYIYITSKMIDVGKVRPTHVLVMQCVIKAQQDLEEKSNGSR